MKLADMTLSSYLELLGSDAPAPGGGSVSALCGAQGAALVAMVAGLTVGKKKYAQEWELCGEVLKKASKLKDGLLSQVDKDTQAFNLVSAAFKLPKESEERKKEIADAPLGATEVPFQTMKLCLEGLKLAKDLVGHSNTSAASDLGVAALNFIAAIKGAWLNVLINLCGIEDKKTAEDFKSEGEKTVAVAQAEADEIYLATLAIL